MIMKRRPIEPLKIRYIPLRYILAMLLALAETLAIIAIVILLSYYVKYFYIAVIITQVVCVLSIIGRSDNPDYKVPWLFVVQPQAKQQAN